jgi:release factor glutamine methyltransferase
MSAQPRAEDDAWTIGRLLNWTSQYLSERQVDDARLSAEVLLAHATALRRIDLYARPDDVPNGDQIARFRELVRRAGMHEPIAYLVGDKEFLSLSFKVTPAVLIPRPETETLVEAVADFCRDRSLGEPRLFDLGTGSGCMAVAVLRLLPGALVVGRDVSKEALGVAAENAVRHQVSDRFTPVPADRLALPADVVPAEGFDVLMSNPPYIPQDEMASLDACVRDYEPAIALTDDADGLSFYHAILKDGPGLLSPRGAVIVEVGDDQANAVRDLMTKSGAFQLTRMVKDSVTRRDRVLVLSRVV